MPIEFKDVASLLSCRKFAEVEMVTGRNGRARCPFHGGEHYNLQFFKDGRCYCHVCHKAGDVVTLASAVWHVSQREAAEMLNEQFILGLDHQAPTPEDRERWQRRLDQRDAQRQAAEDAVAEAEAELVAARSAAETAGPDQDLDELQRQVKNSMDWLRLKMMERTLMAAGR